jgi:putative thioredoxin
VNHPVNPPPGLRGGIDLTALAANAAPAASGPERGNEHHSRDVAFDVVEVTEFSFQTFAERSLEMPVFLLLCSRLAPGCSELRSRVEAIAKEFAGRLVLGAADVDAQPGIAQAFQVQAVPAMLAIVSGRPIPLFQGSPQDDQLRSVFEQVLQIAAEAGVGRGPDGGELPEPEPPPLPPLHQEAFDAIERGDYPAAIAAYDQALKENPRDADARAGRAQVSLLQRAEASDPSAAMAAAQDRPDDVDAQFAAADAELLVGDVEGAFARLLDVLRSLASDEREPVRARLVELFEIVGPTDARVISARKELASLLN